METTWTFRNEKKFEDFITEKASIDLVAAYDELKQQFLADEKSNCFVLSADKAREGNEEHIRFMGVCMNYDAQGTQIGGGKAYLDNDKEIKRKDITIVFM
jgi:hypothetical protein